jgi:hypothetical protein
LSLILSGKKNDVDVDVFLFLLSFSFYFSFSSPGANTTDGVAAAAQAAVFPAGWSVSQVNLTSPFTISPRMTSDGQCFYTIIRDSQDNSYHQYGCGSTTFATDFNPACPAATQSGYVPGSTPAPAPAPSGGTEAPKPEPALSPAHDATVIPANSTQSSSSNAWSAQNAIFVTGMTIAVSLFF